jgi:transposase-like protein
MKIKFKIIETPDYILAVSDEEIEVGDYFYGPAVKKVLYASKDMLSWNNDTTQEHKGWKKIIAYQPKNNASELELPLLPNLCPHCKKGCLELIKGNNLHTIDHYQCSNCDSTYSELPEIVVEDDVEKLNEKLNIVYTLLKRRGLFDTGIEELLKIENLLIQARIESNEKAATKKYSEEDLVEFCMNMLSQYTQGNTNIHNRELLKESLTCKQSKPKWFVAETEFIK